MRLVSLHIAPRGVNGWQSPLLTFGRRTTSLYAKNGSGKTPVVQAIPFCLGFDIKFQNDIREKCAYAELELEHDGVLYKVRRSFDDFLVTTFAEGAERKFFNEGEFSAAIFEEFKLSLPTLVGTNRQATRPFLSSLLPIFYVRQIGGYDEPYRPPANFILDQFVEMIRFVFGLGPKRSYNVQRELIGAREQLEAAQRRIVFQNRVVGDMAATVDDAPATRGQLAQRSTFLSARIEEFRESVDAAGAASEALLELLRTKEERVREVRRRHAELQARVTGIDSIRREIDGEIQTLSLNEESRRVFESFFDVCAREDCGLFLSSAESYGKNLMYLKDQIKDLEGNAGRAAAQLSLLEDRLRDEEQERAAIAAKVQLQSGQVPTGQLVTAVQALTRELLEVEQKQVAIDRLIEEKRKYIQFEEDRNKIQDRIAMLTRQGKSDFEFNALRARLRDLTVKWMDIIGTPNASREVDIDLDFKFKFGSQAIEVFNGSTRSRLILAIHAALFEEYLQVPDRLFRFLILDTPKQQELASEDLERYLVELEGVCDKLGGQVVISATEFHHKIGTSDIEWLPQFPGEKHPMYLGNVPMK